MLRITKMAIISSVVLMGATNIASAIDDNPPPPPPPEEEKVKGNNGWGNGDQAAPGNSLANNNAENNLNGKTHPNFPGLPNPN